MESYYKRRRLSGYEGTDGDLPKRRAQNDRRLKSIFESIFEKYEKNFEGIGDEVDLETGEIVVNNGHILGMKHEKDAGIEGQGSLISPEPDSSLEDESSDTTAATAVPGPAPGCAFENSMDVESEDELGEDKPDATIHTYRCIPSSDRWRLPNHNVTTETKKRKDPKWAAPPLLAGTLRHRPFHRRLALPSVTNLDFATTGQVKFRSSASIWVGERRRRRRIQAHNTVKRHQWSESSTKSDWRSTCGNWTSATERTLKYLKRYTQLTNKELVKYFPNQTEQSLALYWDSVRDDHEDREQHKALYSTRSEQRPSCDLSISSFPGSADFNPYHMTEDYDSHYVMSEKTFDQATTRKDQQCKLTQETLQNSRHSGPGANDSLKTFDAYPVSARPVADQTSQDTGSLHSHGSSHRGLSGKEAPRSEEFPVMHLGDRESRTVARRGSPESDLCSSTIEEVHSPNARLKEIHDSDSPVVSPLPLATVEGSKVRLTELSAPAYALHDAPHSTHVFEKLIDPSLSNDQKCQYTLAEELLNHTPVSPGLPKQDLNVLIQAHGRSGEHLMPCQPWDQSGEKLYEDKMDHNDRSMRGSLMSAKSRSITVKQRIQVVIPLSKERHSQLEVSPPKQSLTKISAHVASYRTAASEGEDRSPPSANDLEIPIPTTDGRSSNDLKTAPPEIADSQPSQVAASTMDGNEKVVHAMSAMDGASNSIDEATMSSSRRRHRASISDDGHSQPVSGTESLPWEVDPVSLSSPPVVEEITCDPKMQTANATGAASFLIKQDDGSEDDLSILPFAIRPKRIFNPLLPKISRPGPTAKPFLTLVDCSDDELAG